MTACPPPDVAGFVLAGGRSTRMGRDKALVELNGKSLAARAVEMLKKAGLSAKIAGARSELGDLAPVLADAAPDEGPLGGISTALAATNAEFALFVPVDLPLLPVALIEFLVRDARTTGAAVTLASVNGFAQTFPVVIRTSLQPLLRGELEAGRRGCFAAFASVAGRIGGAVRVVPVEMLTQAGQVADESGLPAYRWFLNVNSPEDVERAARVRVS